MYNKLLNETVGISEDLYGGSGADYMVQMQDFLHQTMKRGETKNIKGFDVTKKDRNLWEIDGQEFTNIYDLTDKIFQKDSDELLSQEGTGLKVGDRVDSRTEYYDTDEWDTDMEIAAALPFKEDSGEALDVIVKKSGDSMIRYQTSVQNIRKNQDV